MYTENPSNQLDMFDLSAPKPDVNQSAKYLILGNFVATQKLKTTEIKHERKAGLAFVENKHGLDRLEVKYDSDCITGLKRGHHVYIRQNQYNASWATNYFTVNQEEFILIPREAIILVEFN